MGRDGRRFTLVYQEAQTMSDKAITDISTRGFAPSVETSLDAARKSACATRRRQFEVIEIEG